MNTDRATLEALLADQGIRPTADDIDALVALHARESRHFAEIRRLELDWDGPEPGSALAWLEQAAEPDDG